MTIKDLTPIYRDTIHPALKDAFGYRLMHIALKYRKDLIEILSQYDLIPAQLAILRILNNSELLNQAELGKELNHDKVSMVRLIDGLEKGGYVIRTSAAEDKRQRLIQITKLGEKVLSKIIKENIINEKNFLSPLSDKEALMLKKLIMKL